jgi:hypothetical protein
VRFAPLAVAAALCVLAASALGAVGLHLHERAARGTEVGATRASAHAPLGAPQQVIVAPAAVPAVDTPPPAEVGEGATVPSRSKALRRSSEPFPNHAPPELTEIEKIHDAATALRRDHDPSKAARLLAQVPPRSAGPLAEEALALRIEAARERKSPGLTALAAEYLRRYPQGRYAASARAALNAVP